MKHTEYDFPNATLRKMPNGTWREFPKWCLMISVERSRRYVAEALVALRTHRRQST